MKAEDAVVNLIGLNGGTLTGRTRLQKMAYLLQRCGAALELSFTYHYYGPYSFELAEGWEDARAAVRIEIDELPGQYGVPYSVFRLKQRESVHNLGDLSIADAQKHLGRMGSVSDTVLELAATMVYLREEGYEEGVIEELKTRKPLKATEERIGKAANLLTNLGLAPV